MESKENRHFFEIQRYISKKTRQQLRLQDSKGIGAHGVAIAGVLCRNFTRAGDLMLFEWRGEARALLKPITAVEIVG